MVWVALKLHKRKEESVKPIKSTVTKLWNVTLLYLKYSDWTTCIMSYIFKRVMDENNQMDLVKKAFFLQV